jgi:hypothetical protein
VGRRWRREGRKQRVNGRGQSTGGRRQGVERSGCRQHESLFICGSKGRCCTIITTEKNQIVDSREKREVRSEVTEADRALKSKKKRDERR